MSEKKQPEADPVGKVPPANTMPVQESSRTAAPVGVTVAKRTVEVAEAGGKRRLVEMPDEQQLDCHPDIMEAGSNDA